MIIPPRKLSPDTLAMVVEEYVTRDGTEQTDAATKVASVLRCLDSGELVLVYDPEDESCNIVQADRLAGLKVDCDSNPSPTTEQFFILSTRETLRASIRSSHWQAPTTNSFRCNLVVVNNILMPPPIHPHPPLVS